MYFSYLIEPENVNETLEDVSENNWKVIGVTYLSDSRQVLLICEKPDGKPKLSLFKPAEEEAYGS